MVIEQKSFPFVDAHMKFIFLLSALLFQQYAFSQKSVDVTFSNDYKDVYHLTLIIYTPDGRSQTRVSNVNPGEAKSYAFPVGTEIFIVDRRQEEFAMKGNDIRSTGVKPAIVISDKKDTLFIALSSLAPPVEPGR
jgi:hypothetical protein